MIIGDERQLEMLLDLPHVKICSPTGPLEPTASLQLNKYAPDVVFSPCRPSAPPDANSLILTLHDLIYYSHPTPPGSCPHRCAWAGDFHKTTHPAALPAQPRRRGRDGFESTAALIREHELTTKPLFVVPNARSPAAWSPARPRWNVSSPVKRARQAPGVHGFVHAVQERRNSTVGDALATGLPPAPAVKDAAAASGAAHRRTPHR